MPVAEDASNAPKLLKVDVSGNLKVAEQGAGSVEITAPLDAAGNVKTAEKGDWLPSAKGKTYILKAAQITNNTTTIHGVTAGKTFYLIYAALEYKATADNVLCALDIVVGEAVSSLLYYRSHITATYYTSDSGCITMSPAVPLPVAAGSVLRTASYGAGLSATGIVLGWEE